MPNVIPTGVANGGGVVVVCLALVAVPGTRPCRRCAFSLHPSPRRVSGAFILEFNTDDHHQRYALNWLGALPLVKDLA